MKLTRRSTPDSNFDTQLRDLGDRVAAAVRTGAHLGPLLEQAVKLAGGKGDGR